MVVTRPRTPYMCRRRPEFPSLSHYFLLVKVICHKNQLSFFHQPQRPKVFFHWALKIFHSSQMSLQEACKNSLKVIDNFTFSKAARLTRGKQR